MGRNDITADELKTICRYDPTTGIFVRGNRTLHNVHKSGYRRMVINGCIYMQHRLAWLYVYGEWPSGVIDHINGIRDDNRIVNLRDVLPRVNSENRQAAQPNSKTGFLGVSQRKQRFEARIRVNGDEIYLGLFDTKEEAHQAYLSAKRAHHQGCTL